MEQNAKGPAERLIETLLASNEHLHHGRPGLVEEDGRTRTGIRWTPVTHKVQEDGTKKVFKIEKTGYGLRQKNTRTEAGVLTEDGFVENGRRIGRFQDPGLVPEVAKWMYKSVADVWEMDNKFAAQWASYAYKENHKDMKVVLAAFMLVQSRSGQPEMEDGEVVLFDDDYREVGEAMILRSDKDTNGRSLSLDAKLLLRSYDLLNLPEVADINRKLGFGRSLKRAPLGRWPKVVEKWLRHRENNPPIMEGLVKSGQRKMVIRLAQLVRYKPQNPKFFYNVLRWKQQQAPDGHRTLMLGEEVAKAETWDGLNEAEICERITKDKPDWKVITSRIPVELGVTRAIMACAIMEDCLSDKDIVIASASIEALGLLDVQAIKERWTAALAKAEDQRAKNLAKNVKTKAARDAMENSAAEAAQKEVEKATDNIRVFALIDRSGSMTEAIEEAKTYLSQLVEAIPLDRLHVGSFNSTGFVHEIKVASKKGVQVALRGIRANGGTEYGAGVRAVLKEYGKHIKDNEDLVFVFFGDSNARDFVVDFERAGCKPAAFGFVPVGNRATRQYGGSWGEAVERTANRLGVPCIMIDKDTFADAYSVPRTIRHLIETTPVGYTEGKGYNRKSIVDRIQETELLKKPAWA